MSDRDEAELTPEEAFALVGDEIRAQIVRILNEERGGEGAPPALSFSDLYGRFDGDVGSSQFNYHLQKLVGHFVDRTDDGYRIRPEGMALFRAIRGGTFRRPESLNSVDVGLDCYCCGSPVIATYEEGIFTVQCPACDHLYLSSSRVPSSAIDDEHELLARIDQFDRHKTLAFNRGVCPTCADPVASGFVGASEVPFPDSRGRDVYVHRSCARCGNVDYVAPGKALLNDPGLISFFRDHGVDVTTVPQWHLEFAVTDHFTTIRSTDPWEVTVEVTRDGETLEIVFDESASVIERTRT